VDAGGRTLFAPTDAAFATAGITTVPSGADVASTIALLQYHLLLSKVDSSSLAQIQFPFTALDSPLRVTRTAAGVMVNTASVTRADVSANDGAGVIHIIDTVLTVPSSVSVTASTNGNFAKLVTALEKARLNQTVNDLPRITLFAPLDPASSLSGLSDAQLQQALTLHVLDAAVFSTDLESGLVATSLSGVNLTFTGNATQWLVNGVRIVSTDLLTNNGVIHTIEKSLYTAPLSAGASLRVDLFLAVFLLVTLLFQ